MSSSRNAYYALGFPLTLDAVPEQSFTDWKTVPDHRHRDDLVLYDRSLMPPILIEEAANEGVFLNNSVLARIEVKSALNATEIKSYLNAAKSYSSVGFVASPGLSQHTKDNLFVRNCLLAFGSDTKNPTTEIERYIEALQKTECSPTLCSVLCVVGNGLWMLRSSPEGKIGWYRLKSDSGSQQLACFVASISSTLFHAHLERTGGDPASTFEAGIGLYFPHNDEWEEI